MLHFAYCDRGIFRERRNWGFLRIHRMGGGFMAAADLRKSKKRLEDGGRVYLDTEIENVPRYARFGQGPWDGGGGWWWGG